MINNKEKKNINLKKITASFILASSILLTSCENNNNLTETATYNDENQELDKLLIKQEQLNKELATLFKQNKITNFRMTSYGNSIASGYSMVRTTKPLLLRNETLPNIMKENNITLDVHHFARAQNNNDERLFEWLVTNIKESEIHKLNRNDYSDGKTSMTTNGLTPELLDKYYPLNIENDMGLQDIILEYNSNMANIVIYNGCTGSFLDNVTRNGKLTEKLTYGINRDTYGLEAILKYIQTENRINNTNTQVYICGAPNFLGINISEIINKKLKNIAEKYSNVNYIEPIKSKFFYEPINSEKDNKLKPDIHYNEEEYLELNNNIIKSIIDNYLITDAMINIDRQFYHFSSNLEIENQDLINNPDYVQSYIIQCLENESSKINDENIKKEFYKKIKEYLISRTPYDFHYLKKNNINEAYEKVLTK